MTAKNVLYFVCHDLGRALGCYGAGIPTPHLDAFAAQGVRFADAHCASPACSPSRACAMSGMYAHTSGALGLSHMGWPLHERWPTSIDDFNAAGYQTILSGINHERHPRSDRYEVDLNGGWEDWKLPRAVDNTLETLERRDPRRPFYLNIGTQEPHACVWEDLGGRIPALPENGTPWMPPGMIPTPALEAAFRRFAAAVVFVDAEFGRLMRGLDELGLAEDTLVVFTTDHGMSGPRGKGTLYGLGTEIALLMRLPGILPAGAVRDTPVSNLGFRATLAEAVGAPMVSMPQGSSFWPYAIGHGPASDTTLYLERNFHGEKPWRTETDYVDLCDPVRAVRTATHLYVRHFHPGARPAEPLPGGDVITGLPWNRWAESWKIPDQPRPEEELFDLKLDPLELNNVAGDKAHAAVLEDLRSKLAAWMEQTRDYPPGPPPERPEPPGWGPHWP